MSACVCVWVAQWWDHLRAALLLLTSDRVDWLHAALHHVVDVEHLVAQAGGEKRLPITAEEGAVHREAFQVDALDLRVALSVHLQGDTQVRVAKRRRSR